jgi:hypothetical protein
MLESALQARDISHTHAHFLQEIPNFLIRKLKPVSLDPYPFQMEGVRPVRLGRRYINW